jgi:hypothetical protein
VPRITLCNIARLLSAGDGGRVRVTRILRMVSGTVSRHELFDLTSGPSPRRANSKSPYRHIFVLFGELLNEAPPLGKNIETKSSWQ